jgi:hypothetical protein
MEVALPSSNKKMDRFCSPLLLAKVRAVRSKKMDEKGFFLETILYKKFRHKKISVI